jgi:cation diffusion facilitator family transporter
LLILQIMNTKHHSKTLSQALPDESGKSAHAIRRVVRIGCAVNAFLMVLKIVAGHFGHSDALVADGFHSLNDLAADIIMLIFVGISYRAADARYAYGYGKFETFSSFLISAFLIVISLMIGAEAAESVVSYARGEILPQPDIWTFVVVLFAMGCKEGLFHFYSRAGKKADSKALMANAWHHRSDALASVATLVGVTFSHFFGPAFRILDPLASFVIAVFIFVPAVRLFQPAFAELMERSLPVTEVEKARAVIASVAGVEGISYLRTRRNGHHLIFDVGIEVDPHLTIDQGAEIASSIESVLRAAYCPHILVSVTTRPAKS